MLSTTIFFKAVIIFTLTISGLIRGYYELRYRKIELVKVQAGLRERFFVKFVGLCMVGPVLLYLFTDYLGFAAISLPILLRQISCLIMLLNLYYFLRIHMVLGNNWSPILVISKNQKLITNGPYHFIRHPMYASFLIHLVCMLFVSSNWLVGVVGLLSFGTSFVIRLKEEEEMMVEQFGDAYQDYKKKTKRIIPKLF